MDRYSQGRLLHFTATKFIKIHQNNILQGSVTLETSMKKKLVVSSLALLNNVIPTRKKMSPCLLLFITL